MALIICPECGKEISDKAPQCIHCGYPIAELKGKEDEVKVEETIVEEEKNEEQEIKEEGEATQTDTSKYRNCPTCNQLISVKAHSCPHCGHTFVKPVEQKDGVGFWGIVGAVVVAIIIMMFL